MKKRFLFYTSFMFLLMLIGYNLNAGPRKIPDQMKVYNVKKFGARGDNKSDDTKAIQSAINKAVSSGGGIVYFPAGIYVVAGSVKDSADNGSCHSQLYVPFSDIENSRVSQHRNLRLRDWYLSGLLKVVPSSYQPSSAMIQPAQ